MVEGVVIRYAEPFESDVARASAWVRRAAKLRADKYGLAAYRPPVRLQLHPAPTPRADRHITMFGYWGDRPVAEVDALTPSARRWKDGGTSLAGLPYDTDDYREKNVIHEFTHAVQLTVRGEPRDTTYPIWWLEGLPEFDGLFHTSAVNRIEASAALVRSVKPRLPEPSLGASREIDQAFSLDGGYSAGPLFAWFLAEQFGERIHVHLLREAAQGPSFWPDLLRLTDVGSPRALYEPFFEWLATR